MSNKIKLLIQKRTSLKSQITNLANLIEKGTIDNATLKIRSARVTDLYHEFEEHNDELLILDPNDAHLTEFEAVQERYYTLAGKIESILNPNNPSESSASASCEDTRSDDTTTLHKKRRIKLPEAPLPTFDNKFESWLSFKNAFRNMIDSQSDLSDIDKLHYLKSALIGDATNKIKIFSIDGTNYLKAWDVLERAYEVKRVLVSRHLSLHFNLPALEKETISGLTKLADDAQHVASLNALNVSVGSEAIVHLLESKLPKGTLERWETTLEKDEFPSLDCMYEFLYKSAVCASKRERPKTNETERNANEVPMKRKRLSSNRALLTNMSRNCVACKTKRHPLYLYDKFKQLSIPKRIEMVRSAKICYNCLRSHRDSPCKFSNCTICQKRHNTLLHLEQYATAIKADTTPATKTQTS